MKTYIKFLVGLFLKSFANIMLIAFSLVIILNLLSELDFFKGMAIKTYFPIFLSILNSPTLIFEMFPFIFLLSTQLFFISLLNNNEISIFKYSGLKNSKILIIISIVSFVLGFLIITLFYNFSSNLKNLYLELKSNYTKDGKYLAVITKNGLWIRDKIEDTTFIINASKIENEFLIDNFITEFNQDYEVIRNIRSEKIDIKNKKWLIYNPTIYTDSNYKENQENEEIIIETNFDYERIQSLFSNLSSLSLFELIKLRDNYKTLNYSTTEVNIHLLKLFLYPIYMVLMTILSGIIMLKIRKYESSTFKISFGLFLSVIIYYINNFSNILGKVEKIPMSLSVLMPLFLLMMINGMMVYKINDE
jgi:lipopolysaccharide export system permease protein